MDRDEIVEEALDLADDLLEAGGDEDKVLRSVAHFIDGVLDWETLLPGPLGVVVEAKDGDVIEEGLERLVGLVRKAVKVDPEKKAARQARRDARRHDRRMKRERRRAERG